MQKTVNGLMVPVVHNRIRNLSEVIRDLLLDDLKDVVIPQQ